MRAASRLQDGRHVFNAPVILVVPSVTAHGLSFDESSERWVVSVASEYLQHLASRAPEFSELFTRVRCIQCSPHEREYVELRHVLDKLDWEQQRSASCREIVTEALLIDVLVSVLRQLQDGKEAAPEEGATDEHVYEQFSDLVDEHFREHWSLQRFADALDVTVSRLRAACSNVGGQSPIRVINARILLEAKRCLAHTDLTVSEIACRLGFEDASYFSRFFKSRCGQTPTLYKANKADLRARDQQVREKAETPSGMDALKVD